MYPLQYALRPAAQSDFEFIYQVTEAAMRPYVEQTFGTWVPEEQRRMAGESFEPGVYQIITVKDRAAGVLATRAHVDYLKLEKIFLLPEFQGQGIGSSILRQLIHRSRDTGVPIRLRVLNSNLGAQKIYRRFGFTVLRETRDRKYMEYRDL